MANPQLQDGYTQIPNELLDILARIKLSPNQWRVLIYLIRKTYGYHKEADYISNSQIVRATGLHKTTVSHALRRLARANLIDRKGKLIGIQRGWERSQGIGFSGNGGHSEPTNKEQEVTKSENGNQGKASRLSGH